MISGQKAEGQAASVAVAIRRVEGCQTSRVDDRLAVEEPLEIRLGDRNLSITMRTPGNDFELAVGFLHAEGIIRQSDDIRFLGRPPDGNQNIVVLELRESAKGPVRPKRNFVMTSACGVCGKASLRDLQANACPSFHRMTSNSARKLSIAFLVDFARRNLFLKRRVVSTLPQCLILRAIFKQYGKTSDVTMPSTS